MQTALEYIEAKNWEFKKQSGELIVRNCPFCGDEKHHFYIEQEDGLYFCHKCQEKGNLWSLKKHMGDIQETIRPAFKKPKYKKPDQGQADKCHQTLIKNSDAIELLEEDRGFTLDTINRFKLGLCHENSTSWLSIPHFQGKRLVNVKFRSLPPAKKTFKRIKDCESILFNTDAVKEHKEIFVTEGEIDLITLVQAGIENVVGGTTGAGSFDPEWIDQLKSQEKIFICYDSDEAGQKGARSLAKRLGYDRCFNIELPDGQDVNDFFNNGYDIFDFQKLVSQAHKFDLPGVISVDTAIDLLTRQREAGKDEQGLLTPWANVNCFVKGFHPGDLIVVTAPAKTGKTTWCLDIACSLAFQGIPVLFYCLEMRPERLAKKVIQGQYRCEHIGVEELRRAGKEFAGLPLYFAHAFKKQKLDNVLSLIREAIKRYDLKLVVFDNIHFLVRTLANVNEELGQAVQGFKLLGEEMEIPIITIAQPRKRETGGRDEVMRAEDVKYSNSIHADCDQMIILHRKRIASKAKEIDQDGFTAKTEALDPVTLVRIEAHRYGAGGETLLLFHGEYSRFDVLEPAADAHQKRV